MKRVPLIAGNWKMYKTVPEAVATAVELKEAVKNVSGREIVLAPSFVSLFPVAQAVSGSNITISSQDVFWEDEGAFTGQISPAMLLSAGCVYTLMGHWERRQYFGETDETVNRKVKKSIDRGLKAIVCIGESLAEREAGKTFSVLEIQLSEGLNGLTSALMGSVVIAYEPVWAIGTGKTATAAQAEEVHQFIRNKLKDRFGPEWPKKPASFTAEALSRIILIINGGKRYRRRSGGRRFT
jgi:triosephosphate isomerase